MTSEEKTDYKVRATLDREAIRKDIALLIEVLAEKTPYCIVSAADKEEACVLARNHFNVVQGIPIKYIKGIRARRLPT